VNVDSPMPLLHSYLEQLGLKDSKEAKSEAMRVLFDTAKTQVRHRWAHFAPSPARTLDAAFLLG
jgi:hypothetical protein